MLDELNLRNSIILLFLLLVYSGELGMFEVGVAGDEMDDHTVVKRLLSAFAPSEVLEKFILHENKKTTREIHYLVRCLISLQTVIQATRLKVSRIAVKHVQIPL